MQADAPPMIITLPGKRRVDVQIGGHVIHTDQPVANGGEDSAASPFDLFLASIGACAGIFVQGFCAQRDLATEGIRLTQRLEHDASGTLRAVDIAIELPLDFPEKYRAALVRSVEQCSVERAILAQPKFRVHADRAAHVASI
jgi:putative redox protein